MTSDEDGKYRCEDEGRFLDHIHETLKSIDSKVEEILDELRERLECKGTHDEGWSLYDLYHNENDY